MTSFLQQQRIIAAVRGAFIGDAASMGTHWIYDPTEMVKTVTSVEAPEFRDPPQPNFYSVQDFPGHYGTMGMLSPYGEQMLFVTEFVATTTTLDGATMSEAMFEWGTTFGGRPDHALTTFLENMKKPDGSGKWPNCGADDDQAHIYMKMVPIVAKYAGSPDLVDKLTQGIKVHQNNAKAVAFGIASGRLLEAVLLGAPLAQALETVQNNIGNDLASSSSSDLQDEVLQAFARGKKGGTDNGGQKTLDEVLLEVSHEVMEGKSDSPFYDLAGRSCALPGSFIGPIALFYKFASSSSSSDNNNKNSAFALALRENILASGDTCSRAVFVGAVLAAAGVTEGSNNSKWEDAIPAEWNAKMDATTNDKIAAALSKIVA